MIKLIAIDMDGTILCPQLTIREKTKQAILAAQSAGIKVVIATGRSYVEAFDPVREAGLDLDYICLISYLYLLFLMNPQILELLKVYFLKHLYQD